MCNGGLKIYPNLMTNLVRPNRTNKDQAFALPKIGRMSREHSMLVV